MKRSIVSLKKRYILLYSVMFISFMFSSSSLNVNASSSYVPYPPVGTTNGTINVEYEYVVKTIEVGSSWMFDWGDGNYSDWIVFNGSNVFVSQKHSWSEYGVYNVRVKYRSPYMVESPWSSPLVVNISKPADTDGDGWKNNIEIAYGTNPDDPDDHPVDTDNDGIPDDTSPDGRYTGDSDDDDDGLTDDVEVFLGSDPKNSRDVITLFLDYTIFYLVDTNNDGRSDVLYSPQSGSKSEVLNQRDKTLLDVDNDGAWDYTYIKNKGAVKYKEIPWLYVALGVIIMVFSIIFILFKKGILYFYEEEIIVEK